MPKKISSKSASPIEILLASTEQRSKREKERKGVKGNSLLDNPLDSVEACLQHFHLRSVAETHEMMTRRVEQIPASTGVQIEEDAGHDNDFLLETFFEKGEAVVDGMWEAGEVEPDVECAFQGQFSAV